MTYHLLFDHLGNPIEQPTWRSRTPIGHRVLQIGGAIASALLLCVIAWGPR